MPLARLADSLRAPELFLRAGMLRQKGALKQVNAQRDRGIRVLPPDWQFDRYLLTLCSLVLMVVLVIGATGYAGIQGFLSPTTIAEKAVRVEQLDRAARPDRIVTLAVIALALTSILLVVAADRTANPGRDPINAAQRRL